ncbi:hypothetical protein [Sulfurospirillum sp. MES]|uniref:hypothetical protein n=1 Tax=Sulfurospirillum sp. MES TaxID=1565314 RepID=UPI000543E6F7|nr:hypothetical protein [Sulfurospirillum sp. MES]KHG33989.1 MAG: hypothetical protein OA34_06475 [Sulfurospirillum sp. MES]
MKKSLLTLIAIVGLSVPLSAHQLWLEREGSVMNAYFGHWPNFKEKADGKRLEAIKGFDISPKEAYLKTVRQNDHVEVFVNKVGDIGLTEAMEPRKGKMVDFTVRTIFLAREGRSESKTLLELDMVPEASHSNTFTLMLNNKPLPKTKVVLTAPNTWSKNFMSDEAGKVTLQTPWLGDYVAQLDYTDKTKGEVNGKTYEQTNYVMTLHFSVK